MTLLGKSGKCAGEDEREGKRRVRRKTSDAGVLLGKVVGSVCARTGNG